MKLSPGQQLMIDWCELIKNFTPYDAGVSEEAWDTWHARLEAKTREFLATGSNDRYSFAMQVMSLQQVVSEWLEEYHRTYNRSKEA